MARKSQLIRGVVFLSLSLILWGPYGFASGTKNCEMSVFSSEAKKIQGGMVLVSEHPNTTLQGLQPELSAFAWNSILFPLSTCELSQLDNALKKLKKNKQKRVVVLYYGVGLNHFLSYFAKRQKKQIQGLVFLSAFDKNQAVKTPALPKKLPILDVRAQFDYGPVIAAWDKRKKDYKEQPYTQVNFVGAEHDYLDSLQAITSRLVGWMNKRDTPKVAKVKASSTN